MSDDRAPVRLGATAQVARLFRPTPRDVLAVFVSAPLAVHLLSRVADLDAPFSDALRRLIAMWGEVSRLVSQTALGAFSRWVGVELGPAERGLLTLLAFALATTGGVALFRAGESVSGLSDRARRIGPAAEACARLTPTLIWIGAIWLFVGTGATGVLRLADAGCLPFATPGPLVVHAALSGVFLGMMIVFNHVLVGRRLDPDKNVLFELAKVRVVAQPRIWTVLAVLVFGVYFATLMALFNISVADAPPVCPAQSVSITDAWRRNLLAATVMILALFHLATTVNWKALPTAALSAGIIAGIDAGVRLWAAA